MLEAHSRLADYLPYRLAITSNAVTGLIAGDYGEKFGLTVPEWRIMAVLGEAGAMTQRDLVRATLIDKVAVNRACKALDTRGLVARSPNAADGRSHHLLLSEAGRAMHDEIWPLARADYERIFAVLSDAEAQTLRALLDKLFASVRRLKA
jgi:DNA-binding MarR family transcriptional regulator